MFKIQSLIGKWNQFRRSLPFLFYLLKVLYVRETLSTLILSYLTTEAFYWTRNPKVKVLKVPNDQSSRKRQIKRRRIRATSTRPTALGPQQLRNVIVQVSHGVFPASKLGVVVIQLPLLRHAAAGTPWVVADRGHGEAGK